MGLSFPFNRIDALLSFSLSLCNFCCTVALRGGMRLPQSTLVLLVDRGGWPVATLGRAIVQIPCNAEHRLCCEMMECMSIESPPVTTIGRKSRARQEYQRGPTWAILVRNAEQGLLRGEGASCGREDP
jgi:hypothetical protein